jgi:hypothetical protein
MKAIFVSEKEYVMKTVHLRSKTLCSLLVVGFLCLSTGCSKHSAERAGQGAVMGGTVGAVGGFVTGLVFGGNAMENAARGAVYGASTGAASGAIAGAQENKARKQQQSFEEEKIRQKIGEDAYNGVVALIHCKHEVALANAHIAAKKEDRNQALAGLWVEALTYADSKQENKAREMFPRIIEKDGKITSGDQAETHMRQYLQKLMDLRKAQDLPQVCK